MAMIALKCPHIEVINIFLCETTTMMKMRERAGEKEMWMLCKIFSPSLLKSLSFENFSSVALFLSLSRFCRFDRSRSRERERERERTQRSLPDVFYLLHFPQIGTL